MKDEKILKNEKIFFYRILQSVFENSPAILRNVILNELSAARAPHNLLIIQTCFQIDSGIAAKNLAKVFLELLIQREDLLKALRTLIREISRSALRNEFPAAAFVSGLLEKNLMTVDASLRQRTFHAIIELICIAVFLGISPTVRESAASKERKGTLRLNNVCFVVFSVRESAVSKERKVQ